MCSGQFPKTEDSVLKVLLDYAKYTPHNFQGDHVELRWPIISHMGINEQYFGWLRIKLLVCNWSTV